MKKIKTLISLITIAIFSSCQMNQSVNKDLKTGAYSRGDGIGVDDIVIEINGKTDNRNEFVFGENVYFVFNNVSGLKNVDGKTFPELSMFIVKNEKDTIISNPNLINDLNDGTAVSPIQLKANFRAALPYQDNEKYKVFIEITDRKGEGKFVYELPFSVKENELLKINSNGIEYSNIYLWDETLKQPVYESNVNSDHILILILNGIEGLELSYGKVYPIFSLNLIDKNGNVIYSNPNLLSAHEILGVDPIELKTQVTAKLKFREGTVNNPCYLTAKLKDKISTKEVNISTELNIN